MSKLLPRTSVAIIAVLCFVRSLQATPVAGPGVFTINIAPDGAGNVVASGSGDVNLGSAGTGLSNSFSANINPLFDSIVNGPATTTNVTEYTFNSTLTGPSSFGTVAGTPASSGSGSMFLFDDTGFGSFLVAVPTTYTTDTLITNSSTYNGKTLSSLGLTPGTYTWTMGTGNTENTVKIIISATPIPECSSFVLLALGSLSLIVQRQMARHSL